MNQLIANKHGGDVEPTIKSFHSDVELAIHELKSLAGFKFSLKLGEERWAMDRIATAEFYLSKIKQVISTWFCDPDGSIPPGVPLK